MRHDFKPAAWAFLLILAIATAGCATPQGGEPYTVEGFLDDTNTSLVRAAVGLRTAIDLGLVDTSSRDYEQAYEALWQARDMLDAAYTAYGACYEARMIAEQAGQPVPATLTCPEAQVRGDVALSVYMQIRPLLYELTGESL
jgi:hypothetical protein